MSGQRAIKRRKIVLDGKIRYYSVYEFPDIVKVRCYGISKNTYAESTFSWQKVWHFNQYKPSVIALLYDYAVANGWKPDEEKSVISFNGEDALPEGWSNT